jgi:hypothetical protein
MTDLKTVLFWLRRVGASRPAFFFRKANIRREEEDLESAPRSL